VGHLGRLHAKIYSQLPQVELVGVYDLNPEKAAKVAQEFNTQNFSDSGRFLSQIKIASIATTTSQHFPVAEQALSQGIHVLIEKPICDKSDQARKLNNLAREKKLILQVGHVERYNPAVRTLCQSESNLRPMFIEAHRLAAFTERGTDVAVILDLMTHDLDLILSWVDSEVTDIQAAGISVVTDSDDIANARLTFANGCVANITASRVSTKVMRKMRIFQKNLYASLDLAEKSLELYRLVETKAFKNSPTDPALRFAVSLEREEKTVLYHKPEVSNQDMLTLQLTDFIESVSNGHPPQVDGLAGLKVLELALKIQNKIENHRRQVAL